MEIKIMKRVQLVATVSHLGRPYRVDAPAAAYTEEPGAAVMQYYQTYSVEERNPAGEVVEKINHLKLVMDPEEVGIVLPSYRDNHITVTETYETRPALPTVKKHSLIERIYRRGNN